MSKTLQVYLHQGLEPEQIPNFAKLRSQLEVGDFRSAETRKVGENLFRARLDRRDRILFSFARHEGETCILVLEHIPNHAYDRSRFLRLGTKIDEDVEADTASAAVTPEVDLEHELSLAYVNKGIGSFHVLDKVIFLDDAQQAAFTLVPPFVVVGSAGSGKTVLVLEKLKQAVGDVLYVTRSPHLADRSRETYYSLNYGNENQETSFLSYVEFLESIRVPPTHEVSFAEFSNWFSRHKQATGLKDAYRAFEEFGGVITGSAIDTAYLSQENYQELGVRRSIYPQEDRKRVHQLFMKYLQWLKDSELHDVNLLSYDYHNLVEPSWDFVVIDEVQDFTNVQLELVLRSLRNPREFVLCGDANQIVHPNFFSWAGVKSYLYFRGDETGQSGNGKAKRGDGTAEQGQSSSPEQLIRVLTTNYRNSKQVTETANRILRLKHARFGSVDRESNFLVTSNSDKQGGVLLLSDTPGVTTEIDRKTNRSTHHAVIVLHPEQKAEAKKRFRTPLVFSVQEAKGLEYDHVVLYGFVSGDADRFREITRDVNPDDVQTGKLEDLRYARARDKGDRSLEIYKFHINALYVAVTRAIRTVYLVEPEPEQVIFDLLGILPFSGKLELEDDQSSLAEWQREAQKLERQGKAEQAADIRERVLGIREVPWKPLDRAELDELSNEVFCGAADRKSLLRLYEYAVLSHDRPRLSLLAKAGYRPALGSVKAGFSKLVKNQFAVYSFRHTNGIRKLVDQYGVDHRDTFNCTPLMLAVRFNHEQALDMLSEMGADPTLVNSAGLTAFQILLQEIFLDTRRTRRTLEKMYRLLCPTDVSVMVNDRLVKLDNRGAEFLFFQVFMAMFATQMADNLLQDAFVGLSAGDLEEFLKKLPIPDYRKKRRYISSVLARNEVDREQSANRRIFRRTKRGLYILNPGMSVRVGDQWVGIYKLLEPENLLIDQETYGVRYRYMGRRVHLEQQARNLVEQCLSLGSPLEFKSWASFVFGIKS